MSKSDEAVAEAVSPAIATPANAPGKASSASPAATATTTASAASSTVQQTLQAGMFQYLGVSNDAIKGDIVKRWAQRMHDDPDISKLLSSENGKSPLAGQNPLSIVVLFINGLLRISPEERTRLIAFSVKATDGAQANCGHAGTAGNTPPSVSLPKLSDDDVETLFSIVFDVLKQSALQTPIATLTPEQRAQGQQAFAKSLQDVLKSDPEAERIVAATIVDPAGASAEARCNITRFRNKALLAMPQPEQDWAIVSQFVDARARLASLQQLATLHVSPVAPAQPVDFSTQVQRRVQPNIVFSGLAGDLQTSVDIKCDSDGNLLSASIKSGSGNADWDAAVLRAVHASDPMPHDASGHTPREFVAVIKSHN